MCVVVCFVCFFCLFVAVVVCLFVVFLHSAVMNLLRQTSFPERNEKLDIFRCVLSEAFFFFFFIGVFCVQKKNRTKMDSPKMKTKTYPVSVIAAQTVGELKAPSRKLPQMAKARQTVFFFSVFVLTLSTRSETFFYGETRTLARRVFIERSDGANTEFPH